MHQKLLVEKYLLFDKMDFTNEISELSSWDSERREKVAVTCREISPFDYFIILLEEGEVSCVGILAIFRRLLSWRDLLSQGSNKNCYMY